MNNIKTLSIETSCDDTSLAIVSYENGFFDIKKILLHSQIAEHKKFGGVIPELASRLHEKKIIDLLVEIGLKEIEQIDFISYTCCPGLPGSLLVGKTLANTLSLFLNKKKVGVNHIHGHILSIFCGRHIDDIQFPLLVLTVSGGHNDIYILENGKGKVGNEKLTKYLERFSKNYGFERENLISQVGSLTIYKLGFTLDDAAGEAFDKVSRMLGGPYPGGKRIYEKALKGKKMDFDFPRIYLKKDEFNFSFSGLKAQVNYKIQELKQKYGKNLSEETINGIAYEFQQAVIETLGKKLFKVAKYFEIKNIALVGGVSANLTLQNYIKKNMNKFYIKNFYTPIKPLYSTDNAGMIGVAGIFMISNL